MRSGLSALRSTSFEGRYVEGQIESSNESDTTQEIELIFAFLFEKMKRSISHEVLSRFFLILK